MLAAAEGHTEATKHLKDMQKEMDRAAALVHAGAGRHDGLERAGEQSAALSGFGGPVFRVNWKELIQEPFALVGLFDFLLALGLFLNILSLFPVVRVRAMLGMGYFLFYYWSQGDPVSMVAAQWSRGWGCLFAR